MASAGFLLGLSPVLLFAADAGAAAQIAILANSKIVESSGIVASRRNPGVYWTHNDSGDGPFVYAFDRAGKDLGTWRLTGAQAVDWEDIAIGPGPVGGKPYLYLGDIGDDTRRRQEVVVYRVPEPAVSVTAPARGIRRTEAVEALCFRYPDGPHDAEALLIHPVSGDLYIINKARGADSRTWVYKANAPLRSGTPVVLDRIAELNFPDESSVTLLVGRVAGGDISPGGHSVILCDYFHGYELSLADRTNPNLDSIWKQPMKVVDLGKRKQGEGVCYRLDGKAVLATSEGTPCPLFETPFR